MGSKRNLIGQIEPARPNALPRRRPPGYAAPDTLDWPAWASLIERQRRLAPRGQAIAASADYLVRATCRTFGLDGIAIAEQDMIDALTPGAPQRKLRSRSAQYLRNHVAILLSIERSIQRSIPLKGPTVLRWYTLVGSGLPMNTPSADKMARMEQTIGRINSPQLRLLPALLDIARTYWELLSDPLFPSFNGILSRLLLHYHLARCGLPFIVLSPDPADSEQSLALDLLRAIDESFQMQPA